MTDTGIFCENEKLLRDCIRGLLGDDESESDIVKPRDFGISRIAREPILEIERAHQE